MQRDITGILFADVRGYSSLNEKQLRRFHENTLPELSVIIDQFNASHRNTWGDAIVITSNSMRDLANIALSTRDFFKNYDWTDHEIGELDVRVSLHAGEIFTGTDPFTKGGAISGRSVVHAARVEPVVRPGQVWATGEAAAMLRPVDPGPKQRFGLDPIGQVSLHKAFGSAELFMLRYAQEPALSRDELAAILAERSSREVASDTSARVHGSFSVAVGIVLDGDKVVLARRRDKTEFNWMFPSGVVLPLQDPAHRVWREVRAETGLACKVVRLIGERTHPRTKILCRYFLMHPTDGEKLVNGDPNENEAVEWITAAKAVDFIGEELFPPVETLLIGGVEAK